MGPDELLPRRARTSVCDLGFFDPAPVVVVGGEYAAAFEESLEPRRAFAFAGGRAGHRRSDLVGDLIAVGAVGADRAGRSTPSPTDRIEPVGNAPARVDELAA